MAVRQLCVLNNPILKQRCDEVTEFNEDELLGIIGDMIDTMGRYNGCGLSASQIGIPKRIIVAEEPRSHIVTYMINPKILDMSGSEDGLEGCLSYPNMKRKIKRPTHIVVQFQGPTGYFFTKEIDGFMARIICHEIDHLDGICQVVTKKGKR